METFVVVPNAPKIYSENLKIRSYHTNIHRKLTIPKLCSFFQEVAGNHTEACGVGWDMMQSEKVFWVLSRLRIEVSEFPVWQQMVAVKTWSNGLNGLFAVRNFQVVGADGRVQIKAISTWLMVNTETRRLVRPNSYMLDFPLCTDKIFDTEPDKLEAPGEGVVQYPATPVSFTETDMNFHMNNVCYIERVINTFDFDFLNGNEIVEFEVNFNKEAKPGEMLSVKKAQTDTDTYLSALTSPDGKTDYVRTLMKWRKI